MARYTYLACDLRTNAVLDELPLKGINFGAKLNGVGQFSSKFPITDARLAPPRDLVGATRPCRTALYVDRDGVLIWGGIIWKRNYDSHSHLFDLQADEFLSYFDHRLLKTTKVYAAADPLFMMRDLINYAQAASGGNIGVTVGAEVNAGAPAQTISYFPWEARYIGSTLSEISIVAGVDYAIDVGYDGSGNPAKTFRPSWPRRGRAAGQSGHVFEKPGNLVTYSWPEDGTKTANSLYELGAGSGQSMPVSTAVDTSQLDAGYPLLEFSAPQKGFSVQAQLDAAAAADLAALGLPVTIPQLMVRPDQDPVLGAYITGDDVRVRILDERFTTQLDTYLRIVAIDVYPQEPPAPERVRLTLGPTS